MDIIIPPNPSLQASHQSQPVAAVNINNTNTNVIGKTEDTVVTSSKNAEKSSVREEDAGRKSPNEKQRVPMKVAQPSNMAKYGMVITMGQSSTDVTIQIKGIENGMTMATIPSQGLRDFLSSQTEQAKSLDYSVSA